MADNMCQMKVTWKIGEGQIPNGPTLAGTGGKIKLDSFRYDRVPVFRNDPDGTTHHIGRIVDNASMVLIRALEADNNGHNMYPKLWYKIGDQEKTPFEEGPLMLIGSVAKLVMSTHHDISLLYLYEDEILPECGSEGSTGGASKATPPALPWPNKAILEVIIGIAIPSKKSPASGPGKY